MAAAWRLSAANMALTRATKRIFLYVLLALGCLWRCMGQNNDTQNNTQPDQLSFSCRVKDAGSVLLGDKVQLCVFVSTHPFPQLMAFEVQVDRYTGLVLKGTQKALIESVPDGNRTAVTPVYTWMALKIDDASPYKCNSDTDRRRERVSCPQIWATDKYVAPFVNAVINLDKGKITSIVWDNGCYSPCASNSEECLKSADVITLTDTAASGRRLQEEGTDVTTAAPVGEEDEGLDVIEGSVSRDVAPGESPVFFQQLDDDPPEPSIGNFTLTETGGRASQGMCGQNWDKSDNLKIFITWAGTDRKGNHARSAGLRFSRFAGYTIGSLYNSAEQLLT
ncbi:unnamed protein product [Vitrella brassicaformis CCMP3155]|uniref:Uncharacterized protein n=1 Tax=Vitrella brassicaformis (strain CCMP3155) TaxID=1169540 RepID=A0A0G4EM61_VITBC|nr:unnamed protein product [Vitrella brassicaformis CCMP3155]|eukprot:CEL98244.1 unnamed protein product [Vitrella brassicaformis CCMP3155]